MEISAEMAMWMISIFMLVCILWGVRRLIYMHNHSDRYGFGSREIKANIRENTIALNELIRTAHWLYKRYNNGQEIPPVSPQELYVNDKAPPRPDN